MFVDQRKAVKTLASPRRAQLRRIPTLVARGRQPFAPDRVGEIEDAVEEGTVGYNQAIGHEGGIVLLPIDGVVGVQKGP